MEDHEMSHDRNQPTSLSTDQDDVPALKNIPLDRRTLIKGAGIVAVGSAAGAAVGGAKIAFAQDASPASSPGASPAAENGIVPSGVEGVPDVYLKTPEVFKSYDGAPGSGGTVRAFTISYSPPPPGRDSNQYWQELEKRLGVKWEIDMTPQPNYGEKSAAYLAGGDLPDLFYINPGQNATQQYQAMAQGAFLDLTPFVTGDAIAEYKNLASFPQYMWDNLKFQGKIFGVPTPSLRAGNLPYYRSDWSTKLGLEPTNPDSIAQMLVAFSKNDPDGDGSANTWGMGRYSGGWLVYDNLIAAYGYKLPKNWRLNDDGTLTNAIETDEFKQVTEFLTKLFADGGYHPDAASMTFSDAQNAFIAGQTGLHSEGLTSFFGVGNVGYRLQQTSPNATLAPMVPIAPDGSPGVTYNNTGFFGFIGIPTKIGGDEDRVRELLRILDYLASPFGSEEQVFLANGIEGVHWDFNADGARIVNDKGRSERSDLVYFMGNLPVLYYPEDPKIGLQVQKDLKASIALGIDDPTQVLFSQANVDSGPQLNQLGMDSISSIVSGRAAVDTLGDVISQWKSQGGDQIRNEFQEALQNQ
jgi:putative aldouronate transport system substrate-binding protein